MIVTSNCEQTDPVLSGAIETPVMIGTGWLVMVSVAEELTAPEGAGLLTLMEPVP